MNENKLRLKDKIWYGMGDLSGNIMYSAVTFYLLYFFVTVQGINPAFASMIFLIAKGWDAISDYLMGNISDKTRENKYGKRRVYLLFGAIPFGLMFIFLWINPFGVNADQVLKSIYFLLAYLLFNTTWTIVYVPYNALEVNLTKDYDERTSLNGIRIALANIGLLLGAAIFGLLCDGSESILYLELGNYELAYAIGGIIFGVIASVIMLLCALNVKEKPENVKVNSKSFKKTLVEFFKLKEFRNICAYYLLSMVGFDIIMSIFMFYIGDTLGFNELGGGIYTMVFIAIPLVVAILSASFWVKLTEKYSKHKVYAIAVLFICLSLLGVMFVPRQSIVWTAVLVACVGFCMSAIQIIPFASLPDVVEVDQATYGERREGAFYGVSQFLYKFASGVSIALVSAVLALFGYVESTGGQIISQPDSALLAIRIVLAFVPSIMFIVSVIFAYRADLGREKFNEYKEQINKNESEE